MTKDPEQAILADVELLTRYSSSLNIEHQALKVRANMALILWRHAVVGAIQGEGSHSSEASEASGGSCGELCFGRKIWSDSPGYLFELRILKSQKQTEDPEP